MSDEIIFKEKNEAAFWKHWQEYVLQNGISPKYLRTYIEPLLVISKNDSLLKEDKSFVYLRDNKAVALAFLPIEKENKESNRVAIKIEADGNYVLAPLFSDKNIEKKVFSIVDDIAKTSNVSKVMLHIDPLEGARYPYNYLQKYNYLASSVLVYLINTKIGQDLLANCREGCRKLIRSHLKKGEFSVFCIDKDQLDFEAHKEYQALHHKAAGRVTRPQSTFDNQYEELKQGHAVLFGLKYKGKNVAFCYFSFNGKKAIYSSGADDPDFEGLPLYHLLIFSAMEYFQKRNVDFIDVGQPSGPSSQFNYYPDQKQLGISLFKRGFGGNFAEDLRGIKYFSKHSFQEDVKVFSSGYTRNIFVPYAFPREESYASANFQENQWQGDFGDNYTERNLVNADNLDNLTQEAYGISQKELFENFLSKMDRSMRVLEVGSNVGSQLVFLQKMGFNPKNLYGIEVNQRAINICKERNKELNVVYGTALEIPFNDDYFDLVFTAGLLIHISPENLDRTLTEIYRCSKKYIWGLECFGEQSQATHYHGKENMFWKNDFSRKFLRKFPDLRLIKERKLKYLHEENVDSMFLLEKT